MSKLQALSRLFGSTHVSSKVTVENIEEVRFTMFVESSVIQHIRNASVQEFVKLWMPGVDSLTKRSSSAIG